MLNLHDEIRLKDNFEIQEVHTVVRKPKSGATMNLIFKIFITSLLTYYLYIGLGFGSNKQYIDDDNRAFIAISITIGLLMLSFIVGSSYYYYKYRDSSDLSLSKECKDKDGKMLSLLQFLIKHLSVLL